VRLLRQSLIYFGFREPTLDERASWARADPVPWWHLLLVVLVVIAVFALLMWALTGESLVGWLGRAAIIVVPVTLMGAVREQLERRRRTHG